jgi:hypothetical protein
MKNNYQDEHLTKAFSKKRILIIFFSTLLFLPILEAVKYIFPDTHLSFDNIYMYYELATNYIPTWFKSLFMILMCFYSAQYFRQLFDLNKFNFMVYFISMIAIAALLKWKYINIFGVTAFNFCSFCIILSRCLILRRNYKMENNNDGL